MSINFSGERLNQVLTGQKWRTWRPLKGGETLTYRPPFQYMLNLREIPEKYQESLPIPVVERSLTSVNPIIRILSNGRTKYRVGQSHAVGQGRGKPGVWLRADGQPIYDVIQWRCGFDEGCDDKTDYYRYDRRPYLSEHGAKPATLTLSLIDLCRPSEITKEQSIAEGFDQREAFWDVLKDLYGKSFDLGQIGVGLEWPRDTFKAVEKSA